MPINFDLTPYHNNYEVYIETGFYEGASTQSALDLGFREVHSCDINPLFITKGTKKFQKQIEQNRLFLYLQKSTDALKEILENLNEPAIFFLDAHGINYEGHTNNQDFSIEDGCPILEELKTIGAHHIKEHTILVDDLRMFAYQKNTWASHSNIKIRTIVEQIRRINSDYKFGLGEGIAQSVQYPKKEGRYHDLWRDVLIAYMPKEETK